ncbi:hypothetical protein Metme_4291 [Methylomonas methanica MC09]|uniref:Uncharacterized protein n=2 Tax=Methylomonas methanica TaxID=421 RepID=G0A2Y2_METMM|nr:hypothetical protein Metme_4291 [Methylomonas methanica MC09]
MRFATNCRQALYWLALSYFLTRVKRMSRYLLNRLSAIFWLVMIFSLFAKKSVADDYTACFNDTGSLSSAAVVTEHDRDT